MAFFDFLKKKKLEKQKTVEKNNPKQTDERAKFYKELMEEMQKKPLSEHFASGSIFDITRKFHGEFEECVRSGDVSKIHLFIINSYLLFCEHPEVAGGMPNLVRKDLQDTDPRTWNTSFYSLKGNDVAVTCYMPIQNDNLAARMVGIILTDEGDAYYSCMLDKDEDVFSEVKRNKGWQGIETVGGVRGRGMNLANGFLNCIQENFYSAPKCFF